MICVVVWILVKPVEPNHPNVRLRLTNSLMVHGDCISAFADTARECGLSCPDDLSVVRCEVCLGACGSLTTARKILESSVPEIAEDLFEQLVSSVEDYKQKRKQKHCRGLNLEPTALDCSGLAPVVMDLLLQLLESAI